MQILMNLFKYVSVLYFLTVVVRAAGNVTTSWQ